MSIRVGKGLGKLLRSRSNGASGIEVFLKRFFEGWEERRSFCRVGGAQELFFRFLVFFSTR
jgi:hypothetical protein